MDALKRSKAINEIVIYLNFKKGQTYIIIETVIYYTRNESLLSIKKKTKPLIL